MPTLGNPNFSAVPLPNSGSAWDLTRKSAGTGSSDIDFGDEELCTQLEVIYLRCWQLWNVEAMSRS